MAAISHQMSCLKKLILPALFVFVFLPGSVYRLTAQTVPSFHYSIAHPDALFEMEDALTEISGISYLSNGLLACEQDEKGTLYLYDLHKRSVV